MKTYVINLPRSIERRRNVESQLSALGLSFEFSEGVDAKNFLPEEEAAYKKGLAEGIHDLPPGLFGSSWAHIRVYEKMVADNVPVALILEDDIHILPRLVDVLDEPWVRESWWDFVHLGYQSINLHSFRKWLMVSWYRTKNDPRFGFVVLVKLPVVMSVYVFEMLRERLRVLIQKPAAVRFGRPLYLGNAYLLTQEGAKKLLSIAYPIRFTGDRLFNQARVKTGLRFYGYCPPVVRPNDDFPSETGYVMSI